MIGLLIKIVDNLTQGSDIICGIDSSCAFVTSFRLPYWDFTAKSPLYSSLEMFFWRITERSHAVLAEIPCSVHFTLHQSKRIFYAKIL